MNLIKSEKMDKIVFNISQAYHGQSFFDGLKNNETTFRMLRAAVLTKNIPGISGTMYPKQTFSIISGFKSGKARMEINQRKGYKQVIFYEF